MNPLPGSGPMVCPKSSFDSFCLLIGPLVSYTCSLWIILCEMLSSVYFSIWISTAKPNRNAKIDGSVVLAWGNFKKLLLKQIFHQEAVNKTIKITQMKDPPLIDQMVSEKIATRIGLLEFVGIFVSENPSEREWNKIVCRTNCLYSIAYNIFIYTCVAKHGEIVLPCTPIPQVTSFRHGLFLRLFKEIGYWDVSYYYWIYRTDKG